MDKIKIYMAPMEGMTGYVFRNAYHKYFGNVDRYFTPFISSVGFSHRELHDILPENNEGLDVIPQVLTNHAEDFIEIARKLQGYGYQSINLNLGCPSQTVVSKGRGAGFLKFLGELEVFLDEIFEKSPIGISIKTRIGVVSEEEWPALFRLYNRFPVEELIIHPRVQKDFYREPVHMSAFAYACEHAKMPLCYNGELHSAEAFHHFRQEFPQIDRVMFGRGIFKEPRLIEECMGANLAAVEVIEKMFEEILVNYRTEMGSDTPTLYKMKEIWTYFGERPEVDKKLFKQLKKARNLEEFKAAQKNIFFLWKNEKYCKI